MIQTLFERDFASRSDKETLQILGRNSAEFASGMDSDGFAEKLLKIVIGKQKEIDEIISKAAPDWPLEKISTIDRNVLRVGLAELLFAKRDEVPAKVAINEAIELAKTFGGESSGRFVNGVLGSVYKELGEPGKDAPPRRTVDPKKFPVEILGGALVFSKQESDIFVALVHDVFGHWTLSKGHLEEGEEIGPGIKRVVSEEIGIPVKPLEKIGQNEYVASHPEKGKIRKNVVYFLAEAPYQELKLASTGGLDDARWFKLSEILDLNFYNDILPIVTKGVQLLAKTKN